MGKGNIEGKKSSFVFIKRLCEYDGAMTRERFIESIRAQEWYEVEDKVEYILFEREGIFIFVFANRVSESLYNDGWSVGFDEIKTTRSRRHYYEIETLDNRSIVVLSEEDDITVGCMG